MHDRARPLRAVMPVACMAFVLIALLVTGCASESVTGAAHVSSGLPVVTHVENVGGRITLTDLDGRILILAEPDVAFEAEDDGLRQVENVEVPSQVPAEEYPFMPSIPVERQEGLTISRTENVFGSTVTVVFADGSELLLEPQGPIVSIYDVGFVDIDGDGADELLVIALGEPAICNDTYMGYVGWAELGDDGLYHDVQWQEPLGGGLVGLAIADIDGQAGEEVILGVYETYCTGTPSDLWVFSP